MSAIERCLIGCLLVCIFTMPTVAGDAVEEGPPSEDEIRRAVAIVADYDTRFGGSAILRRDGVQHRIWVGRMLRERDAVEIVSGRPYVLIDALRSGGRVKLSETHPIHNVGSEPAPPLNIELPVWVQNLFSSREIVKVLKTVAKGLDSDDDAASRCDGSKSKPAFQVVDGERAQLTLVPGPERVARIEFRGADGSLLEELSVSGPSATVKIDPAMRRDLAAITFLGQAGETVREIPARFSSAPRNVPSPRTPPGEWEDQRVSEALASLRPSCARNGERSLESISRIAEAQSRSFAARVVYWSLVQGKVGW